MNQHDRLGLNQILEKIGKASVLVVGDIMLDQYWWGDVTRISPEAPVPVVRLRKQTYAPGGAANVAANLAGLGVTPILVGAIGKDPEANTFRGLISQLNIASDHLIEMERSTTVKTRIIAHSQQVVRVDQESSEALNSSEEESVVEALAELLKKIDLVIISDYAKGFLTERILRFVIDKAGELGKPVIVDPKGKDFSKYSGASMLTPNRREAAEACRLENESNESIDRAGAQLLRELDLDAVLITRSEDGMTLFREGVPADHLDAMAREIYDVTGAGDTVIACLGASIAAGADYLQAAQLANLGAGLVVEQIGTTYITSERITSALETEAEEMMQSVRESAL